MGEQTQTQPQPSQSPPPPNSSKIPVRPHKLRKLSSRPPNKQEQQQENPKPSHALTLTKPRRKPLPSPPLKSLSSPGQISAALSHLQIADPLLSPLISSKVSPTFDTHQTPFLALTKSILFQQLAQKAGNTTYTKFVDLCGGEANVNPDTVLSLSSQSLREISVSARKSSYLFDLAHKFKAQILSDELIMTLDDKSLFTMLSMVKGIGSWSVHMFMIFSLHRPDVLPVSDIVVRKGVQILYGLGELPRPSQMESLCEKWKPYRSVGAWYMWRLMDDKGGPQAGAVTAFEGINGMPLQQQIVQRDVEVTRQHLQLEEPISDDANFGDYVWEQ